MKGLILSGGRGTRLRPLTHTRAKQLVPVANKPILFFGIEALTEAGIIDIGMVVGDTKDEIIAMVGDGSKWGAKITYIEQEKPLGLAHAVKISRDYIKDEPFVMYLGDNILFESLKPLIDEFLKSKANAQILLKRVDNPEQFGVAECKNGRVIRLEEKPEKPKSNLALVGVYIFDSTIFEAVEHIKPSWRKEYEITDAIQYLIDHGYKVHPHMTDGWWKDTGKLEDLLEANRMVLDRMPKKIEGEVNSGSKVDFRVVIQPGAKIFDSVVRGPAIIGERSLIVNSFIGPFTSIHNDVKILNSEIEHSIVMENSIIDSIDVRIVDSLIGKNVKIGKSKMKPMALRFMVGDNSEVGIL